MTRNTENDTKNPARQFRLSVTLLIIAVVSVIGATVAWFSISDRGQVNSMNLEITSGRDMKFDLDAHATIDQYVETLAFDSIATRIEATKGFNPKNTSLVPVTTSNCTTFTYQDGSAVADTEGDYLTFTLHFMADQNMVVHLTADDEDSQNGTAVTSKNANLANAMRIGFTVDGQSYVYDPGMGNTSTTSGSVKTFGLPSGKDYNDHNSMFSLTAGVDKEVLVHVWLEGNDENCKDDIKGSDYQIYLKFKGTDDENNPLQKEESSTSNGSKYKQKTQQTQQEDNTIWGRIKRFWQKIINNHKTKKFKK